MKEIYEKYYDFLTEWNNKINLTSITQKEEVYSKHFLDSILIADEFSKNAKAHVLIDLLTEDDKKSEKAETEESGEEVDELDEILDEEFVDEEIEAAAKDEEETKSAKGKRNKK